MSRSRAYTRDLAYRKAKRKKRISDSWSFDNIPYYKYLHQYSKGKIHCSCGFCMSKTRNKKYRRRHIHANYSPSINYKHSDLKKVQAMDDNEREYYSF